MAPMTNNPLLKEDGKSIINDLKSSPKNTLVNKLRSTLSKSMQSGNNLKTTPKIGKKSETLKSADINDANHLEKDISSFKPPFKRNPIETSKITDKTEVLCISQPLNTPRRGRKKSVVAQVSVEQNVRGSKQESNDSLSQIVVPSEAIDSSIEVMKKTNSKLHDTSKANKLKSLRNQNLLGPGSPTTSDDKKTSIKKSLTNALQSSKMIKTVKSTKASIQQVNPDAESSQKSNIASNKVRSPRSIKASCDNEPIPSTSYGTSRGRNSRIINISLDLSSEPEDVDIQQNNTKQKKKPKKVCPICKQKFPALLQRNRHLQLVHGRTRNRNEGSISPISVPVNKETVSKVIDSPVKKEPVNKIIDSPVTKHTFNKVADSPAIVPDRSAYQRQCSKPLPPLKRKYQKIGVKNIQPVKRGKF